MTVTGRGVCRYDNGAIYDGDWVNSIMTGTGVYRYAGGGTRSYVGYMVSGTVPRQVERGVYRNVNGCRYDGNFVDDKIHGRGV